MALVFCSPGESSFESIRSEMLSAEELVVVTFNTDTKDEDLIQLLRSRPKNSKLTVYASVPGRWEEYYGKDLKAVADNKARAKKAIAKVVAALDPAAFKSTVDIRFCFANHAKIVVCDQKVAYVGSSNFSTASKNNFEAGYITRETDEIEEVMEFVGELNRASVAYDKVASSPHLSALFDFATEVAGHIETFEWETMEWSMNYHADELEPRFSTEKFGMPVQVEQAIEVAAIAANAISQKYNLESANLDEAAFVDAGIAGRLDELLAMSRAISKRKALVERSESAILSDLAGRTMDTPDEIQESNGFQEAVAAEKEAAIQRAEEASEEFVEAMNDTQKAIVRAFSGMPKIDNTE